MTSDSQLSINVITEHCKEFFEGLKSLMDIRGYTGTMAKSFADLFPQLNYIVLDLPLLIEGCEGSKNLRYVEGDMFKSIPSADIASQKEEKLMFTGSSSLSKLSVTMGPAQLSFVSQALVVFESLFRDGCSKGNMVNAYVVPFGVITDNKSEAIAMKVGLEWCNRNGIKKTECDSMLLIDWISNKTHSPWGNMGHYHLYTVAAGSIRGLVYTSLLRGG
ncbi:putative bidirectional sugar transporter SWEET14-like [Capsicum annuum]|nr:putative bidirectional sugar transporter SWEET14-like [Capsicum annuum]